MEFVRRCIICGCENQVLLIKGNEPADSEDQKYCFVQCPVCQLIYLSPRPLEENIHNYYPPDYHPFSTAIEDDPSWVSRLLRRYDQYKKFRAITRHAKNGGRILDIGCATGLFLHSMQQRGWIAEGVEPSAYAANYASERFHLPVKQTVLEKANFETNSFDVVTLWDVFEHLYDPVQTLSEIYRILKPGGLLLINLPNPDAWESKWFGHSWAGWDIPRHLYLFPLHTMDRMLSNAKLQQIELYSFAGRHGALVLSLGEWLQQRKWDERWKRLLLQIVSSLPAQALTYPFYNVANWMNKSSYMAIYARKIE